MSLTYTTYTAELATMVASQAPDVPFQTILPAIIDYAEQRIYRELDLISTVTVDTSVVLASGNRNATIPNTFIVTNAINVLTPPGSDGNSGSRNQLVPVSREVLDLLWPSNGNTGTPQMYAMTDQWDLVLGPAPDGSYVLETIGTQRPAPLSASNANTFLTQYLPDLFMAASMIFATGYQRNFSAMSNDPQMGTSWEGQYKNLFASAEVEEARKHGRAASWSAYPVSPAAQPQRG